jgi:hypothetical protein
MESALAKLLATLATHGPGFILAAVFIILYILDRKSHKQEIAEERARNEKLAEKLAEISNQSIRTDISLEKTIEMLEKTIDRRMS